MTVSVVIPVYNREQELVRAIKSVLAQTIQDFEILVVDDCSTFNLKPALDNFNDSRIKYFRLPLKGNANVCRNLGIKEAVGDYIALLDSDDEWMPNHLELRKEEIVTKKVDFLFGSIVVNHGTTNRDVVSRPLKAGEKMINYILSDGMAQTSTYFFSSKSVKQVLWDETLDRHQDWDFVVRFTNKFTYSVSFNLTCLVHWISGERKFENFESRMKFIDLYKNEISPINYIDYHRKVYIGIKDRADVAHNVKKHYYLEANKYMQYSTLVNFLEMHATSKTGKLARLGLRMLFAIKIVFRK